LAPIGSSWGNSFVKQEKKIGYVVNKLRLGGIEAAWPLQKGYIRPQSIA
jgi:hypothetical protein